MPKSGASYAQALRTLQNARINGWPIPSDQVSLIESAVRARVDEAVQEKIAGKAKVAAIAQLFEDLRITLKISLKDKGGSDRPKERIAAEIVARVQLLAELDDEIKNS